MKIGKETSGKYCNFDVTFENSEFELLKNYGLTEIQKDGNALVNYAVNKILEKQVKQEGPKSKKSK